jgi:hypothetical protein
VQAQNENLLIFLGLNVSDEHNMIKLEKVDDKYQGDLQLDSYFFIILTSIQQTVINLIQDQIRSHNTNSYGYYNGYYRYFVRNNYNPNLIQQLFGGTLIPQIPLLENVKVHVDGKLDVMSSSKW